MPPPWIITANQPSTGRKGEGREKNECVNLSYVWKPGFSKRSSLEDVDSLFSQIMQHDGDCYATCISVICDNRIFSVNWIPNLQAEPR